MTYPTSGFTPSWAMQHEDNFDKFGLLAERLPTGDVICNLHIVGGLAGIPVAAVWGPESLKSNDGFLLALSIVVRLTNYPDSVNAQLAPFLTQSFQQLTILTNLLDDGTRVSAAQSRVAKVFQNEVLAQAEDSNTLTLSIEELVRSLAIIIRTAFPDEART